MRRRAATLVVVGALSGGGLWSSAVAAAEPAKPGLSVANSPQALFANGIELLERGAFDAAVDRFEALADSGFVHPDASFDRAVAYLGRATSPQARPGDLGQVVAALSEAERLRPGDAEVESALETVRQELANRRVRRGMEPAIVSPSVARALVGLLPESFWLLGATLGSLITSLGLAVRGLTRHKSLRLSGGVAAGVGLGLLLVAGGFAAGAGHFRRDSSPAVVVVPEARLHSADGIPLERQAVSDRHLSVPEGAPVHVLERRGRWLGIEWGRTRAFIAPTEVRILAKP